MCTIGALRFGEDAYLLFKNKDFSLSHYDDTLRLDAACFAPLSLETFADGPGAASVHSGFSIGANRHGLFGCVNHVRNTGAAGRNYGQLCEVALTEAEDVPGALEAVRRDLDAAPSWWGNLVLADREHLAVAELRGAEMKVEYGTDRLFRTNHQPLFGEAASTDGVACSAPRFEAARQRMEAAENLEDILAMLRSHDHGETGICNHVEGMTSVYSYVLVREGGRSRLMVSQGHPCRHDYREMELPLGEAWSDAAGRDFLAAYPTAESHAAA